MDRRHFSPQTGLVPLRRGDDWALDGKIINAYGGLTLYHDLSSLDGASAYFPGASGGLVPGVLAVVDAPNGGVRITAGPTNTAEVLETPEGGSMYLLLSTGGKLQTVEMREAALEILERGFTKA